MKMYIYKLIAICLFLLFMIMFYLQHTGNSYSTLIPGFWVVSESFKEQANLDQLLLYFNEGDGYNYKGYIVITADGKNVFNDTMNFRIIPKGYFKSELYNIIMEKDTKIMPKNLTMEICSKTGSMSLKCLKSKKVYAHLYKNNQLSANTILKIDSKFNTDNDSENVDNDSENVDNDSENVDNDSENVDNDSENVDNDSENVDNDSEKTL